MYIKPIHHKEKFHKNLKYQIAIPHLAKIG